MDLREKNAGRKAVSAPGPGTGGRRVSLGAGDTAPLHLDIPMNVIVREAAHLTGRAPAAAV